MRFINKSLVAFAITTRSSGSGSDISGLLAGSIQRKGGLSTDHDSVGKGMDSHEGGKPLNLDEDLREHNEVAYGEKIAELKLRAVAQAKSARTFAQVQAEIQALQLEARAYRTELGLLDEDSEFRFERNVAPVMYLAKTYALKSDQDKDAVDSAIPALDFSEEQWMAAPELGEILKGPEVFLEGLKRPANCPPAFVHIDGEVVRFEHCLHDDGCTSADKKFVWKMITPRQSKGDRMEAVIAKSRERADFVKQVPLGSVTEISEECATVSQFEKSMKPLHYQHKGHIVGWAIDLSDPRNAIRVGINALKAFEAIHSVGLVYRSARIIFDLKLRMNGDVPAWDQPDVLALDNLEFGSLFVNPEDHTQLSSYTRCDPEDQLYRLSPGEIRGYCSTRADDLYRFSEALFKSCGTFINQTTERVAAEWMDIKRGWRLQEETLGVYYKGSNEKYYKVLNEFHDAMFVLSNDRSMEKPDYDGWIERFNAVLEEN